MQVKELVEYNSKSQTYNIQESDETRQQRYTSLSARTVCGISTEVAGSQRSLLMILREIARQSTNLYKPVELKSRESVCLYITQKTLFCVKRRRIGHFKWDCPLLWKRPVEE